MRQHLVHTGLRARVGLVAEAGDAFDIHHFATLIGYGAEAVHPWLALETLDAVFGEAREPSRREREAEASARLSPAEARVQFRSAAEKGLLKILSKMGISTLSSYCGAQIFEVLGLGHEVIATCFAGTASPLGGIGFEEIAEDVLGAAPGGVSGHGRRAGVAARSRSGPLPEGRRGPRLGSSRRGGPAAGGEGATAPRRTAASW